MSADDKQALNNKSNRKVLEIIKNIKKWTYSCEPVYIKKSNGIMFKNITKLKSFWPSPATAIPSLNDIIVQTAIKLLMDTKITNCEIFNGQSFGFRPNRSVHHALNSVKCMKGVTWIIEGKIKSFFDPSIGPFKGRPLQRRGSFVGKINYNLLINIIKNKLNPDKTVLGIFNKLFKVGPLVNPYFDIISPILFNLYLTPLDEFIDKLKEKYAISPFHIKIYYVRFADEWVIGVKFEELGDVGVNQLELNKKELVNIQEQIKAFLRDSLNLELEKNKLTHLMGQHRNLKDSAKFLGHYLSLPSKVNTALKEHPKYYSSPNSYPEFAPTILIPFNDLKDKLIEKGFADASGFPKYVGKLLHLSDYDIVKYYNRLLTNTLIFYSMADNCSGLREFFYILEYSLAHTLAAKHRSSLAKIFKKYGKPIVVNSRDLGKVRFTQPSKAEYLNNRFHKELEMWKLEYNTNDPISIHS